MDTIKIFDDLYLFSSYIGFIDLTFNQYLLTGSEPVLVHTGSIDQAKALLPGLKEMLEGRQLSYIFISHFESDECGGLRYLLEHFPGAKPVCSQVTARQLTGFGLAGDIMAKAPGDVLEAGGFRLRLLSYPSEMHLWEGLMAFEENRGLLFSSDLFIRRGALRDKIVESRLEDELQGILPSQIPDPEAYRTVQQNIRDIPVKYIIPGHGPCVRLA
jgi:flavorubredoxin